MMVLMGGVILIVRSFRRPDFSVFYPNLSDFWYMAADREALSNI